MTLIVSVLDLVVLIHSLMLYSPAGSGCRDAQVQVIDSPGTATFRSIGTV